MHYSLARATTWNLAGYLYLIVASLISTPILVHSLGVTQFAQYGLIIATLVLVSSFDLGLPQAVVRALAREYKSLTKRQIIWATSSVLFTLTGLLSAVVATTIISRFNPATPLLLTTFALALMTSLVGHYSTLPQAEGHFGYFNAKTFIVGTGNTLLAAYLAYSGYGILAILTGQLACYFLSLLALVYFSLKFFPNPMDGRPSLTVAKSLASFGIKNQVGKVVGQVQAQYAKYLLSSVSPLSLSSYLIATGLVQKLSGGIAQLATAIYPASARKSNISSLRSIYYRLQAGLFLLGLMGIGVYQLVGLPFLTWWLHAPELVGMVDSVMKVLVWYFAILVTTPLASSILDSQGRPEITSFFAFVTTAFEIALALLIFPKYGLFAPVYASLIAILLTTPFLLYTTDRIIKVKS
jgi:O-antigen/teichoic acid export membrane protein